MNNVISMDAYRRYMTPRPVRQIVTKPAGQVVVESTGGTLIVGLASLAGAVAGAVGGYKLVQYVWGR